MWVDDDAVTNTNEAFAAASCTNCAAVAVSFQVVLVMGDADVVVPVNTAVAVNYECTACLTYALAAQLVITLDGPVSDETMAALQELWAEIAAYGTTITDAPLADIQATLEGYKAEILAILETDPAFIPIDPPNASDAPSDPSSPTGDGEPSADPTSTDSATPSPTSDESETPSSSPTGSSSASPSNPTETPSATPSGSASPSGSPSTSPSGSMSPEASPSAATSPSAETTQREVAMAG